MDLLSSLFKIDCFPAPCWRLRRVFCRWFLFYRDYFDLCQHFRVSKCILLAFFGFLCFLLKSDLRVGSFVVVAGTGLIIRANFVIFYLEFDVAGE